MKEVNFVDRVPTHPGRVVLTPVSGQANTFDMVRADEPRVAGTPLDKATFNSMVHSRLTGRYYGLSVSREVLRTTTGTADPIPATGWVENSYTNFVSGSYKLTASYPDYPNLPPRAFDDSTTTYWAAESDSGETWIAVDFGVRIVVTKLSVCWFSYDYDRFEVSFQGSNNGINWETIASTTGNRETPTEWSFDNTAEYSMYRLLFKQGTENAMRLYDWSIIEWSASVYKNLYTSDGMPSEWTKGQRVLVETPADVNTIGVSVNALNGVIINTILQSSKRYELCYDGSAFVAKEV